MMKVQSAWLSLGVVVLTSASCGSPEPSRPPDGGGGADGSIDGDDGASRPFGLELLAGDIGGRGNVDGTGAAARFQRPRGVAVDSAGNVYIGDAFNHTLRKITSAGIVTTLAGTAGMSGRVDSTGALARFSLPGGVTVDTAGNVYVADQETHTIRKVTAAGVVTTLAGAAGGSDSFRNPSGVAVDSASNIYVADRSNHAIRKISAAGVVTTVAGTVGVSGSANGTGAEARFFFPSGVAVDGAGNVYVADQGNFTIRKITDAGVVTTLAGTARMSGSTDATGADARFRSPSGVAVDSAGNIYVADTNNDTIRKVTSGGTVTTLAGTAGMSGSADATGAEARFRRPSGVAVDSVGNIYVTDEVNHTIRKVTDTGAVTTLAGTASLLGTADGAGSDARFFEPGSLAADSAGNVYVADQENHTIRKVTAAGIVTTLAGAAGMPGSADGTVTAARFDIPAGVAVDNTGTIYVAEASNHTVRKITAELVTTLAGTAEMSGSADDTGAAARFNEPLGVAADSAGNVYVADTGNSTIRKITAAGVVTTLAGTAGMTGSANGTGAAARFNIPFGVAVDSMGNVYVADSGNNTLRKVTAGGVVTTLAGTAELPGGADGTGAAARFNFPVGVAVDSSGNLYLADHFNATIRKVTPTGITTTIAGTPGMSAILLGATPRFAFPKGLAIVGDSIVISDSNALLLLRHGAR